MPQPTIISEGDGRTDRVLMGVAASTVIEVGDLVYASVGKIYLVASAAANTKFQGIAGESSSATESKAITVYIKCVIDVDVTAAASYFVGKGLMYTSTNALVDDSGADTLGWVHENNFGSAITRLRVLIDVPRIRQLYAVST